MTGSAGPDTRKVIRNGILSGLLLVGTLVLTTAPWAGSQAAEPAVAEACARCHGPGGVSSEPTTPVIAGLSKGFLVGAMLAYQYADDISRAEAIIESDSELEDIVVMSRPAISDDHIPSHYAIEEIKVLAEYFAAQEFVRPKQVTDAAKVAEGRKLHDKYCEKCHEDGGASTLDDVGLLAGQWMPYLRNTLAAFASGDRQMPKKMSQKMKALRAKHGDQGIDALTHFYGSQE